MYFFNHAQPALLYLVPCILISSTFTALIQKDFKVLFNFNEEKISKEEEEDEDDDEEEEEKKKTEKENEKEKEDKKKKNE